MKEEGREEGRKEEETWIPVQEGYSSTHPEGSAWAAKGALPQAQGCKALTDLGLEKEASEDNDSAVTGTRVGFVAEMVF